MRVLSHGCVHFSLPLARPLATAHGTISRREGIWVRLVDDAGHVGFGEAAPLPGFGLETLAETSTALEHGADALGALPASATLDIALDVALAETEKAPCARGALDTALHDLAARRAELPLALHQARYSL
jgi:L-alanine-DL-glutamate epimerase-like enolase superfamily enzyme